MFLESKRTWVQESGYQKDQHQSQDGQKQRKPPLKVFKSSLDHTMCKHIMYYASREIKHHAKDRKKHAKDNARESCVQLP